MVVLIGSFQYYYIDTHIHLSFNVFHLIQKWKKKVFLVLLINIPLSNVIYVTNFTISQIANYVCLTHIKHLFVKRINMCMQNRKEFRETFTYLVLTKLVYINLNHITVVIL